MNPTSPRKTDLDIHPQFIQRWSPRAFDPAPIEAPLRDALFEAARWAPSCFNDQPWRFLYADDPTTLPLFRSLIAEGNRGWADRAPLLIFVLARKNFTHNGQPNGWGAFDAGAAWMSLALQARWLGLESHAMGGFLADQAYEALGVSREEYEILAAVAVGRMGNPADLPEALSQREHPSDRKPLVEIAHKGPLR